MSFNLRSCSYFAAGPFRSHLRRLWRDIHCSLDCLGLANRQDSTGQIRHTTHLASARVHACSAVCLVLRYFAPVKIRTPANTIRSVSSESAWASVPPR